MANTLINHSQVFGIVTPNYFGIDESWFFCHFDGLLGSLTKADNYRDFLDLYCQTNYFRNSPVNKEDLVEFEPRNYADFFRSFMELAANGAALSSEPIRYWLEKSPIHTLYLRELISYYPDALFVGIERELLDVVRSTKKWQQKRSGVDKLPATFLPQAVFHWGRSRSFLRHYSRQYPERFHLLSYKAVEREPIAGFGEVFAFLNLEWEATVLEDRYGVNTAFTNSRREDALSTGEEMAVRIFEGGARLMPFTLYKYVESKQRPRYNHSAQFLF